jgi:hypothetical protein
MKAYAIRNLEEINAINKRITKALKEKSAQDLQKE